MSWLQSIFNSGISEESDSIQRSKIRLTNILSLIIILICLSNIPLYIIFELYHMSFFMMIMCLLFTTIIPFNIFGFYSTAKTGILVIGNVFIFGYTLFLGPDGGAQYYFFTGCVIPFLLFTKNEKLIRNIFVIISFILYLISELELFRVMDQYYVTDENSIYLRLAAICFVFMLLYWCGYDLIRREGIQASEARKKESNN